MRSLFEASAFLVLALAAHLAFWAPETDGGIEGAGAEGQSLLSIKASSASVARMVEAWETPPDTAADIEPTLAQPDLADPTVVPPPLPVQVAATQMARLQQPVPVLPKMAVHPEAPTLPTYQKPPPRKTPKAPEQPQVSVENTMPAPVVVTGKTPGRPVAAAKPVLAAVPPPEAPPVVSVETAEPKAPQKPTPKKPASPPKKTKKKTVEKKKPSKSSAGANARVAQGAGGGVAKGNNQKSRVATLSKNKKNSLITRWGGQIRARVARRAPRGVGRGTAVVTITVSANGALLGVRLAKSSGNPKIDKLAVAAVRNAGRFPAAPKALGLQKHSFRLPVTSK